LGATGEVVALICGESISQRSSHMSSRFEFLEAEALKLPPEERVLLADHLLASLGVHAEVEEAWVVEVERRLAEVEAGRVTLVPAEEAISRARKALQ
jgi:putative addiction module component (TIGR02574 family)